MDRERAAWPGMGRPAKGARVGNEGPQKGTKSTGASDFVHSFTVFESLN